MSTECFPFFLENLTVKPISIFTSRKFFNILQLHLHMLFHTEASFKEFWFLAYSTSWSCGPL